MAAGSDINITENIDPVFIPPELVAQNCLSTISKVYRHTKYLTERFSKRRGDLPVERITTTSTSGILYNSGHFLHMPFRLLKNIKENNAARLVIAVGRWKCVNPYSIKKRSLSRVV